MKKTSKTIVFFGNERLATGVTTTAPTLHALIAAGFTIGALVIAQNKVGRSRQPRSLEVAVVAEQLGIPLVIPEKLSDAEDQLANISAQIGVLIAYGQIVPQNILDLFPNGIINVHPSLLPLQRGSTPVESVILNGATKTGVSLMRLAPEMDAGPIYAQQTVSLQGNETKQGLSDILSAMGSSLLLQYLPRILDGSAEPIAQNDKAATYSKRIHKQDGMIDWTKSAIQLERDVRAYSGWPRSRTKIGNSEVIITQARVIEGQGETGTVWSESKMLGLHTSDGILVIDKLIPAGRHEMSAAAFLAGYKLT